MEQVIAELSELNKKVAVIVGIMKKPQNRFIKVLEIAGTVITVMSLLSVIDLIRHWLGFAV
jgi:preprotein translocase subunit Sss1